MGVLNPEFKEKWCQALESDEFPQTQGTLRDASGYCCLGVALEVAGDGKWKDDRFGGFAWTETSVCYGTDIERAYGKMPSSQFCNKFGLIEIEQDKLARMNDGVAEFASNRQTFKQIAEYIRKNL